MDLPDDGAGRTPSELSLDPAAVSLDIHYHTERERLARDSGLLRFDEALASVARAHSRDMRTREYIGHESPDGGDVGSRLDRFGYTPPGREDRRGARFGENIARNAYRLPIASAGRRINHSADELAAHVVQQWLDSPGHRENLLDGRWVREGIGTALYPYRAGAFVVVTQLFCDV